MTSSSRPKPPSEGQQGNSDNGDVKVWKTPCAPLASSPQTILAFSLAIMNGNAVASNRMPWETLGSVLGFQTEDTEYWWKWTAPVLGKFMRRAGYSVDQQFSYLS